MHQHYSCHPVNRKIRMAFEVIASMSKITPSRKQTHCLKNKKTLFESDSEESESDGGDDQQFDMDVNQGNN